MDRRGALACHCVVALGLLWGCSSGAPPNPPPAPTQGPLQVDAHPETKGMNQEAVNAIYALGGEVAVEQGEVVVYLTAPALAEGTAPITNAALVYVAQLPQIHQLYAVNTQITDAGLAHLKGLTRLRVLNLDGSQITDAGLDQLHALQSLKLCFFRNTHVTPQGVERLRKAIPGVLVTYSSP
jgi:hypothetical protein